MPAPVETGPEFEVNALQLARAIHDPLGLQGALMFEGREHDGVFIDDTSVHAFEFTTRRDKAKAEADSAKLAKVLKYFTSQPANKHKGAMGWFVTADEPTAEQRGAVATQARKAGVSINAISIRTLRGRVCDVEGYLRCRENAPFGSTSYGRQKGVPDVTIDPLFVGSIGQASTVPVMARTLAEGKRVLLVGEFGAGKSFALRLLHRELRRRYFKNAAVERFPVHINLRDCTGLRSPAEILRRHAEEVGFSGDRGLISAWRAGACTLLLDGFDEVIPTKWMGNAADLKQVRWQALESVRRLVQEAPRDAGLIICGRSHYFGAQREMLDALALNEDGEVFEITDFSPEQRAEYLEKAGVSTNIPEWLPARPLLLGYLAAAGDLGALLDHEGLSQADAWRSLLTLLSEREAQMFAGVRPETIRTILSRVATLARARGNELGPVGMDQMQQAFFDINGYYPDEEGIQLLLRLPGLAVDENHRARFEGRVFVDRALASTAYGEDLAMYIASPYDGHPLCRPASWVAACDDLAIDVAARAVDELGLNARAVVVAADRRESEAQLDAVLADIVRVSDTLNQSSATTRSYLIEGVLFEHLSPSTSEPALAGCQLRECLIQTLDMSSVESADDCPTFESCLVGNVEGLASLPDWLTSKFRDTYVEEYSKLSQTTAGILQLSIPREDAVALTILKKVYSQRGRGRKEGALHRGLDPMPCRTGRSG